MKLTYKNGEITIIVHDKLYVMAEVETGENTAGWITFGSIASDNHILIESEEWNAFKELIDEVDEVVLNSNKRIMKNKL